MIGVSTGAYHGLSSPTEHNGPGPRGIFAFHDAVHSHVCPASSPLFFRISVVPRCTEHARSSCAGACCRALSSHALQPLHNVQTMARGVEEASSLRKHGIRPDVPQRCARIYGCQPPLRHPRTHPTRGPLAPCLSYLATSISALSRASRRAASSATPCWHPHPRARAILSFFRHRHPVAPRALEPSTPPRPQARAMTCNIHVFMPYPRTFRPVHRPRAAGH